MEVARVAQRLSRLGMVAVLISAAFVVTIVGPTSLLPSAKATCLGQGNPATIYSYYNGTLRGKEWAVLGTCDGDGIYRGKVSDLKTDGRCMYAKFMDAGIVSTQGIDCTTDNTGVQYSFYDRNGDHSAYIKVCPEGLCGDFAWIHIWGY